MQIHVKGLEDERFVRPLQLITNLFFEDGVISFSHLQSDETVIEFHMEISDHVYVFGTLQSQDENRYSAECTNKFPKNETEKEQMKIIKNTVSHVYLQLLEEWTGIIQEWGILTGVRPTKLLHKHLRQGAPNEEVHQRLRDVYSISDEKISLMQEIVDRQLEVIPDLYSLKSEVSIYIGIPFCPTKCAYCTFPAYAINGRQGSVNSFLGGLHYEMRKIGEWLKENNVKITTIYFGGGTPTSISAEEMDSLYEEMVASFPNIESVREVTVEAGRPDTITPEKLSILKKWHIDRISINPQSFIQETLKAIGRHHTVEETINKFNLARSAGMNNINMDLILGLPGEGSEELSYSLQETEKLMPESLTVHTLSFKRASEMTKNKQKYKVANRDEVAKMMSLAKQWTKDHNYAPYYLYRQKNILGNMENIGYALQGHESIYNILIMEEQQSIIGLGCGAASKFIHPKTGKITHFANPKDPKTYNESFEAYVEKKIHILNELFEINQALTE